jgi:prepilin-type N-terminal cleavage/methylation domain-containing protein
MKALREHDGFTLVELMVVVLILGILVAVAIPIFTGVQARAKVNTCFANQRTIGGAIQAYRSATTLLPGPGRLNGNNTLNTADVLIPNYLKAAPRCPRAREMGASTAWYYVDAAGSVTGDHSGTGWVAGHSSY